MRDLEYERVWFDRLREAGERSGVFPDPLISRTLSRLAMGAEQYGDEDFVTKDVVEEARDEAADLIGYALLETHKRNALNRDGQHHLFEAAVHAAVAFHHFRLAQADA